MIYTSERALMRVDEESENNRPKESEAETVCNYM